jgi:hypothetical protein
LQIRATTDLTHNGPRTIIASYATG